MSINQKPETYELSDIAIGQPVPVVHAPDMQPGMQQPVMQPGMQQQPMMEPGMQQQPMMQPGMQQPMMEPGMQQPIMQPGMQQQPMMQPGMQQQPMVYDSMQQPTMQPGLQPILQQQPMEQLGMQQQLIQPGMQQPGMMQAASAATEADKKIGGIGKCCHKCEQPAKFICQAKIACKERGCGKPFCSDHRARKCNGKSNKEYVCCDCEDEAHNASWFCGIGCGVMSCCSCVACWVILCYVIIPLLFVTAA